MTISKRSLLKTALTTTLLLSGAAYMAVPGAALAQDDYPNRTINLVVGFAPGGGTDAIARVVAAGLSEYFGVEAIVDNRPGANATIGTQYVVDAEPDGYTLQMATTGSILISPNVNENLRYDPRTDLKPISLLTRIGSIIALPIESRFDSLEDMLQEARDNPGTVTYATSGVGSPQHLAGLALDLLAGSQMVAVPYQGTGPGMAAVLGGHVDAILTQPQAVMGHVEAGTMKVFGVSTAERSASYPDIPTIAEQGYEGYEVTNWYALFAPAGTPDAIIEKLNEAVDVIMESDIMISTLAEIGSDPIGSSPEELAQVVESELALYAELLEGLDFEE